MKVKKFTVAIALSEQLENEAMDAIYLKKAYEICNGKEDTLKTLEKLYNDVKECIDKLDMMGIKRFTVEITLSEQIENEARDGIYLKKAYEICNGKEDALKSIGKFYNDVKEYIETKINEKNYE